MSGYLVGTILIVDLVLIIMYGTLKTNIRIQILRVHEQVVVGARTNLAHRLEQFRREAVRAHLARHQLCQQLGSKWRIM